MYMEDIESLYSPSQWSKRLNSEDVQKFHILFLNEHSRRVKELIPSKLNQPYGPGQRDMYDIFGTDLEDDSPILIHIHGGYYQEESITHSNNAFIANNFYTNGIKTILIGYELSPKRTIFQILKNLQIGIEKCLQYARNLNSRGVYLSGHSAGAHAIVSLYANLSKTLQQEDQQIIKAVFLISGFYDMTPITKMSVNKLLNVTEETARNKLSPLYDSFKYEYYTKMHIIVAENDSPSFIDQSKQFYEKLQNESVESEFNIVKNVDHFDIIENLYFQDFYLTQLIISAINKNLR